MHTLIALNGITDPNRLYVGQRLYVGGDVGNDPPPWHDPYRVHVVQRGETLYRIARRYGVNLWDLIRLNHISNPNRIYAGQQLIIP